MASMEDLVAELERSHADAQERMSDPAVFSDRAASADAGRRLKELEGPFRLAREWREASDDLEAAREDADLHELVPELEERVERLEEEIKIALVERDPHDGRDVIVEIRKGAGGDEAAIWAGDLYRMLTRYAERRGLRTEVLGSDPSDAGGFNDVTFAVKGGDAYSIFKWEGGTHRVQRVPATESAGRIHTSTATVAVMPEAEEVEVEIDPERAEDRRLPLDRPGRSERQHDRLGRADHAPADGPRRRDAGREVAAPEQDEGAARVARAPARARARETARGAVRAAALADRYAVSERRRSARTTTPRTGSPTTASG